MNDFIVFNRLIEQLYQQLILQFKIKIFSETVVQSTQDVTCFKVAISAADSVGTVSHRYGRRGPDSSETRETLHRGLKNVEKSQQNFKKM